MRKMISIEIEESKPCVISSNLSACIDSFQYYDITFTANSYVYRQVISVNVL